MANNKDLNPEEPLPENSDLGAVFKWLKTRQNLLNEAREELATTTVGIRTARKKLDSEFLEELRLGKELLLKSRTEDLTLAEYLKYDEPIQKYLFDLRLKRIEIFSMLSSGKKYLDCLERVATELWLPYESECKAIPMLYGKVLGLYEQIIQLAESYELYMSAYMELKAYQFRIYGL